MGKRRRNTGAARNEGQAEQGPAVRLPVSQVVGALRAGNEARGSAERRAPGLGWSAGRVLWRGRRAGSGARGAGKGNHRALAA